MKTHLLKHLLIAAWLGWNVGVAAADREQDLVKILRTSSDPAQKADVAARLRLVGTADAVPALAALLNDDAAAHAARHALEGIPVPEAGAALRQAFLASSGSRRIGLIDSLGWRREPQAVALLIPLLSEADDTLASVAATAIGRIGGADAFAALDAARDLVPTAARPALFDALLRGAEQELIQGNRAQATVIYRSLFDAKESESIRTAAYAGMIRSADDGGLRLTLSALEGRDSAAANAALLLAGDLHNPEATRAFAQLLPGSSPEQQVALLLVLQARGDRTALPAVLAAIDSANPEVRAAAASAVGFLGDATSVPRLAKAATSPEASEQSAARQALVILRDGEVTAALTSALWTATPPVQMELVRALSERSDPAAIPALLELAGDENAPARRVALQALAQLVDRRHLNALVRLLVNSKSPAVRDQLRGVFQALIERTPDPQQLDIAPILGGLENRDVGVREAILPISVLFVDDRTRAAVRAALKDPEPRVRTAAARALCTSADTGLLPDMLLLARETGDASLRTLALEGSVRLATDETVALSTQQRVDALAAATDMATRAEQKRLILSGLARVPHPVTLELAEQACADSAVRAEAELACLQIAQELSADDFSAAQAALTRLMAQSANASLRAMAQASLKQLDSGWQCTGPYRIAGKQGSDLFEISFPPEQPNAGGVSWRRAPGSADLARVGEVDLASIVGGDHCVVYAKSRVHVPSAQSVMFAIGSDDGIKLWVNGTLVHAHNAVRGLTPDQDRATGLLREGWNELLVKITQHTAGCGFTLRIRKPAGAEVPGLRWNTAAH